MESCTSEKAKIMSDKFLGKKKFDLKDYYSSIEENEKEFIVTYALKDTMQLGGGAVINISKETCKIIKSELFQ